MDKTIVDQANNDGQKKKTEKKKENEKNSEGRIIVRNISEEQRKKLLSGGASVLAGMLGGAGAFSLMSFVSEEESVNALPPDPEPNPTPDPVEPDPVPVPDPVVIYTEAPFAQHVDDSMSFGEAFAAARVEVGPGGIFEWHGNTYGTYYKSEWDALTPDDKHEYWEGVANATSKIEEEEIVINEEIDDHHDNDDNHDDNHDNDDDQGNDDNHDNDDNNIVVEEEVFTISDDDFIESIDIDGDGIADIALVDANSNDAPDLVLDTDGDGNMDVLVLDVDAETGEITGDEVMVEIDADGHYQLPEEEMHLADNHDILSDNDLNPDIDNDMDMDEYIG